MIEIQEYQFLDWIGITTAVNETGIGAYELSGDFCQFANEQLYAQMMGWA